MSSKRNKRALSPSSVQISLDPLPPIKLPKPICFTPADVPIQPGLSPQKKQRIRMTLEPTIKGQNTIDSPALLFQDIHPGGDFESTQEEILDPYYTHSSPGSSTLTANEPPSLDILPSEEIDGAQPDPDSYYREFYEAVMVEAIPFLRIGSDLYVVTGWDTRSGRRTNAWYHVQIDYSQGLAQPRYLEDTPIEPLFNDDNPLYHIIPFAESDHDHGKIRHFSVGSAKEPLVAKYCVVVIYTGPDSGAGHWRCSKDGSLVLCSHITECQNYLQQLLTGDPNAKRPEIEHSLLEVRQVKEAPGKPHQAVSHLSIAPPSWARISSDQVDYLEAPPLESHPGTLLLSNNSQCLCGAKYSPEGEIFWRTCTVYTLLRPYTTQIQLQKCLNCNTKRYPSAAIGPDGRDLGIFNYNNTTLFSHDVLDEYTMAYTSSETPFVAFVTSMSRRYKMRTNPPVPFPHENTFRAAWFGYANLLDLSNDMKQLQDSLSPPTLPHATSVSRNCHYPKNQSLIQLDKLRKLLSFICNGSSLVIPQQKESSMSEKEVQASIKNLETVLERIKAIPKAQEEILNHCPELLDLFLEFYGEEQFGKHKEPPKAVREFFSQISANESCLQLINRSSLCVLQDFINGPSLAKLNRLACIPCIYWLIVERWKEERQFSETLLKTLTWVASCVQQTLESCITYDALPLDETITESDSEWKKTAIAPIHKYDVGNARQCDLRNQLADEMLEELHECPVEDFMKHYIPYDLNDNYVQRALEHLQNLELLSPEHGWKDFDVLPSSVAGTEEHIFSGLKPIADALGQVGCGRRSRQFSYDECPNVTPIAEIEGAGFRVDACLHPTGSPFSLTTDVAVIMGFKKEKKAEVVRENHRQVASAANFLMNDDPRRMWMYAISIEDELMSVWKFSRSHSVKPENFSFIERPDILVKFFLLFLFAREDEIGFDPSVHRLIDKDNKIYYIYEIEQEDAAEEFSEISVVNDTQGKEIDKEPEQEKELVCISGRQTRIWRAIEVNGKTAGARAIGKSEVALKDVWIDKDSRSEFQIQEMINKKLRALKPEDFLWADESLRQEIEHALSEFPKNLPLMQIVCGGWGAETEPRSDARLEPKFLFPDKISPTPTLSSRSTNPRSTQARHSASGTDGYVPTAARIPRFPDREFTAKRQYRLVYDRVGCSLSEAEDLSSSFTAIKDAYIALVLLFLAGWVHRDVSAGNIIVTKDANGRVSGRLSDIEYAKESDRVGEGVLDHKTGTAFFMPIEIHSGMPLLVRPRPVQSNRETDQLVSPPNLSSRAFAVFGAHHDAESLAAWTSLWVVLCRVEYAAALGAAPLIYTNGETPTEERQRLFRGISDPRIEAGIHPKLYSYGFFDIFGQITAALCNACLVSPDSREQKMSHQNLHNFVYSCLCQFVDIAARAQAQHVNLRQLSHKTKDSSISPGKRSTEKVNQYFTDGKSKSKSKKRKEETALNQAEDRICTRASKKAKLSH
ncbi:hypothetical protein NP233_g9831 [Leucocoprinus birnbaumii]|uniref:Fungal-type protein kinase domain-containing protein n=1 Tax=Leucocoprinus birnbaumii TaxID=56174 RepID=A0AAD5VJQ3_9AGAR|nr:hypothetical protein NP233_g9831 [Leucocoprinus birnbaumii]